MVSIGGRHKLIDGPLTKETVEDRPWINPAILSREEVSSTGVYGIGLMVDVKPNKPFKVLRVSGLQDAHSTDISSSVSVGDILISVNDRSCVKEGTGIIENAILGNVNSIVKLTLQNHRTSEMYVLMVRRHVEIRSWEFTRQWYTVRDEFIGGDILTSPRIVTILDNLRRICIDEQGREIDFLAGIKKRGSSCGVHLNGKTVERVVAGSPGALAQISPGDTVVSVDGDSRDDVIATALGGDERIGSTCRLSLRRSGQLREVEVGRTQISAMNRAEELLSMIDSLNPAELKEKVIELERERQYEERVVAGRINNSQTTLLDEVFDAVGTIIPPRPALKDLSGDLERLKKENSDLAMHMASEKRYVVDLQAELERLRKEMLGMVPALEADQLRSENEALKKQLADMVPRLQYEKLDKSMQTLVAELRDESNQRQAKLKASEDANTALRDENDELRRRLRKLEEENAALKADLAAAKKQLKDAESGRDGLDAALELLKRQLVAANDELEALKTKLKTVEGTKNAIQTDNDALNRKIKILTDENAELRSERDDSKAKMKEAQAEADRLAAENDSLKRRLTQYDADRAEMEALIASLMRGLKQAESERDKLSLELDPMKRNVQSLQEELDTANASNMALKKENDKMQIEYEEMSRKLVQANSELEILKVDVEALKKELKNVKDEKHDLLGQIDTLKRKLDEANDKALRLEQENKVLAKQVASANEQIARMKGEMQAVMKKLSEAEDKTITQASEIESLKSLLQEAKAQITSLQKELKTTKDEYDRLQAELKKAQDRASALALELEESKTEARREMSDHSGTKSQIPELKEKAREAERRATMLAAELEGARQQLTEEREKSARLVEQLGEVKQELEDAKQKLKIANDLATALKGEVEKLKKQLSDALAAHAETQAALDALKKELQVAGLWDDKLRARLFVVLTALQAPPCSMEQLCLLLETMGKDRSVRPQDVQSLLTLLLEASYKRSMKEVEVAVKVLNGEAPWSSDMLLQMRQRLLSQGVTKPAQIIICPSIEQHDELDALRKRVRELMAPEFEDTKPTNGTDRILVRIRGRAGATIYACIRQDAKEPTKDEFDKCCTSPMDLVLEESCIVTAVSSVDGVPDVELSETKQEVYVMPSEHVGVGMLLEQEDDSAEIVVKGLTIGGEVEKDGRVNVGDILLEIDGRDLVGMRVQDVFGLILGVPGTEITLTLIRKGDQTGLIPGQKISVTLHRKKNPAVQSTLNNNRGFKTVAKSVKAFLGGSKAASIAETPSPTTDAKSPLSSTSPLRRVALHTAYSPTQSAPPPPPPPAVAMTSPPPVASPTESTAPPGSLAGAGQSSGALRPLTATVDSPGIYITASPSGVSLESDLLIAM